MTSLRYHEINLGVGSRALKRWTTLGSMIKEVIYQYRAEHEYESANTLKQYLTTLRWCVKEQHHWTIELEIDEWKALSSGLRHPTAPTAFMSMYVWLNTHRVEDHGN